MNTTIERAAVSARPEDIATKLRNAPTWVRQCVTGCAAAGNPARPAAKSPAPPAAARWVGWIAGTCCPGVSKPAYQHRDGETLPEQFTTACWQRMLDRVQRGSQPATLRWEHRGDTLAVAPFDLTLAVDRTCGLQFEARLRAGDRTRQVLDEIDTVAGLGVSVGYKPLEQWVVERDGIGRVRVIDDAVLHHIALIPRGKDYGPAYAAARAYGARGGSLACPSSCLRSAHAWAFRILRQQAGCRA